MQDDYSGLSRAYTTAPARAFQELNHRLTSIHALIDVAADALASHNVCEFSQIERVLVDATDDLWQLQQEAEALFKATPDQEVSDE